MHSGCDRAKSETQGSVGGLSASQRLQAFLKLIRWPNLMMMALTLWLIRYSFFQPLDIPVVLSDGQFALLVLSTLCIGAAGYVVNDETVAVLIKQAQPLLLQQLNRQWLQNFHRAIVDRRQALLHQPRSPYRRSYE